MANPNYIASEWKALCEAAFPANMPTIQYVEMRRAFYAGAAAVIKLTNQISEPQVSEDDAVDVLDFMHEELREFWQKEVQ